MKGLTFDGICGNLVDSNKSMKGIKLMKKFIAEFKEFALKGNMIDLAIGMIIATSFNAVVKSIVDDLIMPAFAFIFGKSDFSQLVAFAEYAEDGTLIGGIKYGMFIQNIVNCRNHIVCCTPKSRSVVRVVVEIVKVVATS